MRNAALTHRARRWLLAAGVGMILTVPHQEQPRYKQRGIT